jgi:hypothetical protein
VPEPKNINAPNVTTAARSMKAALKRRESTLLRSAKKVRMKRRRA